MRNILLLILNNMKVTFRKKGSLLVYIVVPIACILLSISLNGGSSDNLNIGILNKDNGRISKDLVDSIRKNEKFTVTTVRESEIKDKIASRKLDCVIEIPENFQESIYNNKIDRLNIVSIKGEESVAWITSYVDFYIKNLSDISSASKGNRATFDKIYNGFMKEGITLSIEKLKDESHSKNATMQSIGFLIMIVMIGAINTSNIILKERRNRTYYRICTAPVSSAAYIIANIITNIIIIAIQIIVVILAATKILRMETFIPDFELITILIVFGIAAVGLGILIVALSKTSYQVGTMMTLISTPTCMLAGCFWPSEIMPIALQKIGNFLPQKWTLDAVLKLQTGSRFSDIFINLGIILAFAAAFFIIAAYKFNSMDKVKNFI